MVFRPTRSFHAAGTRTEPAVSEPMPAAARPKATEAAAPEEEPPGASSGSLMLGGVAVTGLRPRPEKASSVRWVLPRQTRPARVAVASTAASRSGTRPASSAEPASVAMPAVSKRSFQLIGTPSSGAAAQAGRGAVGGGGGLGAGALGRGAGVDAGAFRVAVDGGEVDLGQLARVDGAGLDLAAEVARRHPEPGVGHACPRVRFCADRSRARGGWTIAKPGRDSPRQWRTIATS